MEIINKLLGGVDWSEIWVATLDTLFMLSFALVFSVLIGLIIGFIIFLTSRKQLLENLIIHNILSFSVNILRSIPFIILLILMLPVTTFLVGTSLGAKGVIPPLVVGASPFFARLIENSLRQIEPGIFDMAKSYGANTWQTIWYVLLPEALPNLVACITVTAITLISYTAMAGTVGGGGLGDLAIRYGYHRFETEVMLITVVLLVVLVQLIQFIGDKLTEFLRK